VDPDRLPEEKARGITIDLGFAPLPLPGGGQAAFVDVPGHERFVRTMVAGASGIDLALLVVAADEGPMPQTREHLAILDLLGVPRLVAVLTKRDLVDDEWLALVEADVVAMLAHTPYAQAPVVAVSAATGDGLDALRALLARAIAQAPGHPVDAPSRLPVDRVFTRPGFGPVVTGTLIAGAIAAEDRLVVYPAGTPVRVRRVQVHGRDRDRAEAGERTALNLGGIERAALARGDVVAAPGAVVVSRVLVADLRLVPAAVPLRTGRTVHIHVGTAERVGRLVWLDADVVAGGEGAAARFHLRAPLPVAAGDRLVVRGGTPVATVGGGVVLDVRGEGYRRGRRESLEALAAARTGGDRARILAALGRSHGQPQDVASLAGACGLTDSAVADALAMLASGGEVAEVPGGGWLAGGDWRRIGEEVATTLAAYHAAHPMRPGAPREEVRRRAAPGLDGRRFAAAVEGWRREGRLAARGDRLALPGHVPAQGEQAQAALAAVSGRLRAAGLAVVAAADAGAGVADADEVLALLVANGEAVRLGDAGYVDAGAVAGARAVLLEMLAAGAGVMAAAYRDRLGVSRKVAVALLEHFDAVHLTRRQGDAHVAAAPEAAR